MVRAQWPRVWPPSGSQPDESRKIQTENKVQTGRESHQQVPKKTLDKLDRFVGDKRTFVLGKVASLSTTPVLPYTFKPRRLNFSHKSIIMLIGIFQHLHLIEKSIRSCSVTRWLDYSVDIVPYTAIKICLIALKFPKVDPKICRIINKPYTNGRRLFKFCQ